jgi:hypothetical protein
LTARVTVKAIRTNAINKVALCSVPLADLTATVSDECAGVRIRQQEVNATDAKGIARLFEPGKNLVSADI